MKPEEAIGLPIYQVVKRAPYLNTDGDCVGLEAILRVGQTDRHLGSFAVDLVTKDQFLSEAFEEMYEQMDRPELHVPSEGDEYKHPFVLNDRRITDDVIRRKFIGRVIEADLAASLWELAGGTPSTDEENSVIS